MISKVIHLTITEWAQDQAYWMFMCAMSFYVGIQWGRIK